MSEFSDLKFIRLTSTAQFGIIPEYLFEQLKEQPDIKRVYQVGALAIASPLVFIYVMADSNHKIKGVLWLDINLLEKFVFVELLSLDREYQSETGDAIMHVVEFIKTIQFGPEVTKKIVFATTRPGKFTNLGFIKNKKVIMELNYEA